MSKGFIDESAQNKRGNNVGLRSIWFNGRKMNAKKEKISYAYPKYKKYLVARLGDRILREIPT